MIHHPTQIVINACLCVALLAAAVLLVGCRHKTRGADIASHPDRMAYPQVVGLDGLGKDLRVDTATVRRNEQQAMVVSVPIRLDQPEDRAVQYRFSFFARDGMPLTPQMEWRYMVMPARGRVNMTGSSLSSDAADWRLEVRMAR